MPNQSARIHQFRSVLDVIPRLTDTIGIVGSLLLLGARGSQSERQEVWLAAVMAVVVYYMTAEVTGLFRSWHGVSAEREVGCSALTWALAVPILLAIGFLTGNLGAGHDELSRGGLVRWFLLAPAAIAAGRIAYRMALRGVRKRGWNTRGFAIVGANELGFQLARNIEGSPQMGLKLVGFFDDRPPERRAAIPGDATEHASAISTICSRRRATAEFT